MSRALDQAAVAQYRDAGYFAPLRVFTPRQARAMRAAIEDFEAQRGPVFTENRPRPGDPFQGSYRFKSHLLFKWLSDAVRSPVILDAVQDLYD